MTSPAADPGPAVRTIAMPADTNPAGDIFGGWLMAQMDLAAGNVAARRPERVPGAGEGRRRGDGARRAGLGRADLDAVPGLGLAPPAGF